MVAPAKLCPLCGVRYDAAATFCQKDGARLTAEGEEDPFLGKMLLDQFRIEEAIGAGGMGTVYRARQTSLNRDVAIKILHSELTRNPDAVRRFRREAKVATQLEHPNLVRVFLFGELPKTDDIPDGGLYLAMEYLDGRSMVDLMREEGPLPVPRALHLILQTSGAIGAAHAQGIVHRDVKPENIIVLKKHGDPDYVKVLDFGIARLLWGEHTALTQSGVIFGTARYISPEGASGEPTDARSDVYSLGVLAYQLLTGVTPFEASTPVAMLMKHIHEEAPDLRRMGLGSQVPSEIADVIMRCLAKNPDMRWDDASQLAAALTVAAQQANVMLPSARRTWSMAPAEASSSFGTPITGLPKRKKRSGPSPIALAAAFILGATAVTGGAILLKEALTGDSAEVDPVDALMAEAERALADGRFDAPADSNVESITHRILDENPHHAAALALRREAVAQLRTRAEDARAAGDFDRAHDELLRLLHFLPADREARDLLATVERERSAQREPAGVHTEPEAVQRGQMASFVGIVPMGSRGGEARFEIRSGRRLLRRIPAVHVRGTRRWVASYQFGSAGDYTLRFVHEPAEGEPQQWDIDLEVGRPTVAGRTRTTRTTAPTPSPTPMRTPTPPPPVEPAGSDGIDWTVPPLGGTMTPEPDPEPEEAAPPPWTGSGSVI
ncbi:MAG: serine/threonine protein kinase [Deltaproteobacteria bacterium]|nr:serine/threonine protein kinase [Deltaproteobacteria bacterium]